MAEVLIQGVRFATYFLELALLAYLVWRGESKRLYGVFLYVAATLTADGARSYVLHVYGLNSSRYAYCFYLTDFFLVLVAFLLIYSLFQRACQAEGKMWRFVRLFLVFVFLLVFGISSFSLSRNYGQIITRFIVEFEQNLYFTCLVLNTLLFLLMRQVQSVNDELELLVCGIGIQFAGPAAGWALVTLTPGQTYSGSLVRFIMPFCALGMLLVWSYAITRIPRAEELLAEKGRAKDSRTADVAVSEA